ncbi:MAG: rod shape-determining protein [Myxococcota bacterium]|nr:rod shape-determining protein [Myxococcota bacterium]
MLPQALGRLTNDVAVDLGTSNTQIFVRGRGLLVEEPSVVAIQGQGASQRIVTVGLEARRMLGRTPENIRTVRPIRQGVIAEYELAEALLRSCVLRALGIKPLLKPRMVICVPLGSTEVERRAIQELARSIGTRESILVSKPIVAALGAGLPVSDPVGSLVVDVGGGTTEVGLISLGGLVCSAAATVAGDDLDQALVHWIRDRHQVLIGERAAEELKQRVGCGESGVRDTTKVMGRDVQTGRTREVEVPASDAREAFEAPLERVVDAIRETLTVAPPELAADVLDRGVLLCGGGSLLKGIAQYLGQRTGLPVIRAEDPLRCVIQGAGMLLDEPEYMLGRLR